MRESITTFQTQIREKATPNNVSTENRRKYRCSGGEAAMIQAPKKRPSPREQLEGLLPLLEHPNRHTRVLLL